MLRTPSSKRNKRFSAQAATLSTKRRCFELLEYRTLLSAGPQLVSDILPGASFTAEPTVPIDVGGALFFRADDGVNGSELWRVMGRPLAL